MWTEGVDEKEARLVIESVQGFLRRVYEICLRAGFAPPPTAIRPFGTWVIPSVPVGSPYWGSHWYLDSSYDPELRQVIGPRFLQVIREEPWQKVEPHYDIAVVERDLTDSPEKTVPRAWGSFALSSTLPGVGAVMSVHRIRELVQEEARCQALRRLVFHSFGHVLRLLPKSRQQGVETSFGDRHCANRCVMRHAPTPEELVRLAKEEEQERVAFCAYCERDVLTELLLSHFSPN